MNELKRRLENLMRTENVNPEDYNECGFILVTASLSKNIDLASLSDKDIRSLIQAYKQFTPRQKASIYQLGKQMGLC